MGETYSTWGERRGVYRFVVGTPDGKTPLAIPRRKWDDNIKLDLQEIECGTRTILICLRIRTDGGHL
jgi:hypothetical protein